MIEFVRYIRPEYSELKMKSIHYIKACIAAYAEAWAVWMSVTLTLNYDYVFLALVRTAIAGEVGN